MCFLNGWHPFESIRFDLVKINMWRCLVLQIWEQQKQRLRKQRVIQSIMDYKNDSAGPTSSCDHQDSCLSWDNLRHMNSPVLAEIKLDSKHSLYISVTYVPTSLSS